MADTKQATPDRCPTCESDMRAIRNEIDTEADRPPYLCDDSWHAGEFNETEELFLKSLWQDLVDIEGRIDARLETLKRMASRSGPDRTSARNFFRNDPRFRGANSEPYTDAEMAHVATDINGIDAFEFAEIYAREAGPDRGQQDAPLDGKLHGAQPISEDWEQVWDLLDRWKQVWHGDRGKYISEYPAWIVSASEELFAHDMCDAWNWNDYVKAAAVIIQRHFAAKAAREGQAPKGDREC